MDIWMAAVAAGAGYIAQHFKKSNQAGQQTPSEPWFDGLFSVKPDSPNRPPDKKSPFRRLSKRENSKQDDFEVRNEVFQGVSSTELTSTIELDGEKGVFLGEGMGDSSNGSLTPRNRMFFRSRRKIGRAIRPLSSLESCLMAQLYKQPVEPKEYLSSSFAQPVRPFVVTDGSKVISRAINDAVSEENTDFYGVSDTRTLKIKGKEKANTMERFDLSGGSSDAPLLLCLGMSFGILSSFVAHRREIEKLNRSLKQTESLVQDLEEELEMKDSLIMQELKSDDHKSQKMDVELSDDGSPPVSRDPDWDESTNGNNKEPVNQKAKGDSFSKIEAELEAELEMLELNMTSSTLERRISNLVELDPSFEPGVARGESGTTTTTTRSANYAVSPRELSLRLHEVLESQLEERIRELEAEIKNNRAQNQKSWKDFSSSDENLVDEPVVLNLSGEALDAYNEACNEFAKLDESDEEDLGADGTPIINQREDDKDFDEDEMEKMLINRIVEKARQGSPVVLNAQRALFSE